jgi:hypothetical protein
MKDPYIFFYYIKSLAQKNLFIFPYMFTLVFFTLKNKRPFPFVS